MEQNKVEKDVVSEALESIEPVKLKKKDVYASGDIGTFIYLPALAALAVFSKDDSGYMYSAFHPFYILIEHFSSIAFLLFDLFIFACFIGIAFRFRYAMVLQVAESIFPKNSPWLQYYRDKDAGFEAKADEFDRKMAQKVGRSGQKIVNRAENAAGLIITHQYGNDIVSAANNAQAKQKYRQDVAAEDAKIDAIYDAEEAEEAPSNRRYS